MYDRFQLCVIAVKAGAQEECDFSLWQQRRKGEKVTADKIYADAALHI